MNAYTPTQVAEILQNYELNALRHREAQRAYYQRKKEERRAYARAYYIMHREEVLERMKRNNTPQTATTDPVGLA
jgi:hypothetical protein